MNNEYWREKLTARDRALYDRMKDAFYHYQEHVSCADFSVKKLNEIYFAIVSDHPELYYLPSQCEVKQTVSILGTKSEFVIKNLFGRAQIEAYDRALEDIKFEFSAKLRACKNDFDRERLTCEYLLERTTYKLNNKLNQNAATVLTCKMGQCSGISKAAKLLLNWCGISNIVVSGTAKDSNTGKMLPHAWNIVEINGHCYHLDVTYMLGANPRKTMPYNYSYFNYMDSEMEKTHAWDKSQTPECSYYYVNKSMITRPQSAADGADFVDTAFQLTQMIEDAVRRGDRMLTVQSEIAVAQNELLAVVQNCCKKAMDKLVMKGAISITVQGTLVQLRW